RLACIFPVAELPPLKGAYQGGYVLYLSLGLVGEARGLARYLAGADDRHGGQPLTLLQANDAWGQRAGEAFDREWKAAGAPTELRKQVIRKRRGWRKALARLRAEPAVVILPGRQARAVLEAIARMNPQELPARLYLPGTVLPALRRSSLPAGTVARIRIVTRYDDPKAIHPDSYRARAWIRSRKLAIPDWNLMRETFFALRLVDNALEPLQADYYRDYLIEILEHITEVGLDPGPFPHPELGPDQRVASRGVYIMRWDPVDQVLVPVSPWVVVGG
ncbi:MAG: ABC transporter substrate-binding protein, partial [Alphaproteobacteria bacterium]